MIENKSRSIGKSISWRILEINLGLLANQSLGEYWLHVIRF